jgi:hypothetical protein
MTRADKAPITGKASTMANAGLRWRTLALSLMASVFFGVIPGIVPAAAVAQSVNKVRVAVPAESSPVVIRAAEILSRQIRRRCDAETVAAGEAPLVIELSVRPGIGAEGFSIVDVSPGVVRIAGNEPRGVLYGVGKFLHTSRYDQGGFTPSTWRGESVPQKPIRGIYFATHFHNFYHDAPVEEIQRYVEEMGLWGYNVVLFWYDTHHFDGYDDPKAVEFRSRIDAICETAREIGLDVGTGVVANQAYNNSPAELRADRGDVGIARGCYYPCDVCPSKPEGMKYLQRTMAQTFDWCARLGIRYLQIWPYDSGGCVCSWCRPWGGNGFLKTAESLAAMARQKLPGVKIIASTWMFDQEEWQMFDKAFSEKTPWADCVLAEGVRRDPPGRLPMIGFPEISMYGSFPWGGFGATPLPNHFQGQWNDAKRRVAGGFVYSEGIFEDINKVLFSRFYWEDQPANETIKEYIAFEYSPAVVNEVLKIIATLEQNHHMRWWPGELEGVKLDLDWFPSRGVKPQADPGAEEAFELAQQIDAELSPQARRAWRWRQLFLRALLDAELKKNHGSPNEACRGAFAELIGIYHAENANPCMRPPLDRPF